MTPSRSHVLIPDLHIGNLASVVNMIKKCGGSAQIISTPDALIDDAKIILAGVGSFDAAMGAIADGGWGEPLTDRVIDRKTPVLGICLGMQILGKSSEEGRRPGLGWIDAEVKRFQFPPDSALKIPHMGWNTVSVAKNNPLLSESDGAQRFYFVHSYHVVCRDAGDVLATVRHGNDVTAAVARDNIFGVQFHPEKSHRFGMALLQRFLEI